MIRWLLIPCALVLLPGCAGCSNGLLDPMKKQHKYAAYREGPFFEDGRAMRPLVEGTVPRERKRGAPAVITGRVDAEEVRRIPLPVSRAFVLRGRHAFENTCAACHGLLGDGDSVVARKMALRPPPSLIELRDRPAGHFYTVMTEGYGLMPSYAEVLPVEERWAVVAYVRALQRSQHARLEDAPDDVRQKLLEERP